MKDLYKVVDKVEKAIDKSYDRGYADGHKEGLKEGKSVGFDEGVEAQKAHIQSRLRFAEELAMSAGRGPEAIRMREVAEFLAFEYDPEAAERQVAYEEENGLF